jgi:hypothetical protein
VELIDDKRDNLELMTIKILVFRHRLLQLLAARDVLYLLHPNILIIERYNSITMRRLQYPSIFISLGAACFPNSDLSQVFEV